LNPVASLAGEWVVLNKIDISKKTERIKYAKFLKEQHYEITYRTIPELTPQEKKWIKSREKDIDYALNNIKDHETPLMKSQEGRAWLAMDAQYRSSTLYLQNELKGCLKNVLTALDIIIESKDILKEMAGWSFLVYDLLDYPLRGDKFNEAVSVLENDKGIVFSKKTFAFDNMPNPIAREITWYIISGYFLGKIKE
jgi:hypothetical protein